MFKWDRIFTIPFHMEDKPSLRKFWEDQGLPTYRDPAGGMWQNKFWQYSENAVNMYWPKPVKK